MGKQVTEKHFKESIKQNPDVIRITKLQVNPEAYTDVVSDFFIQTDKYDYYVECKQVSLRRVKKNKPSFNWKKRFTQEYQLNNYDGKPSRNRAFLFLVFWDKSKKTSDSYFIPMKAWMRWRKSFPNHGPLNQEQAKEMFETYLVPTDSNNKHWCFDL